MEVKIIGIDLSKNTFHIYGVDAQGKCVLRKQISRKKMLTYFSNHPRCLIGIEACSGSNYWQRRLEAQGHDVRQMAPQFVKPYVKSNKNDFNDAEAICEAVSRPNMRFVARKSVEQQDIQSLHRIRAQVIKRRTALSNEIRGLLAEYGLTIRQGVRVVCKSLPEILEDDTNELTTITRGLFSDLLIEYKHLLSLQEKYDAQIEEVFKLNDICQRIGKIEGIGPISATAIIASVGDAKVFKNGREMAAWLGLVPGQASSGGKTKLLGITKRGDTYLRTALIHGGRAAMRWIKIKSEENLNTRLNYFKKLEEKKGVNKAAVALANKNVRIIWSMMVTGDDYRFN